MEINYVSMLANPQIRSACMEVVTKVDWKESSLDLLLYLTALGAGKIPEVGALKSHLYSRGYSEQESEKIAGYAAQYVMLSPEGVSQCLGDLDKYVRQRMLSSYLGEYGKDKDENALMTAISNMPSISRHSLPIDNMNDLHPLDVIAKETGNTQPLPSGFSAVKVNNPHEGYLRGTINLFAAAPGGGKTMAMINEAITIARAGFKVYYCAIGDMMRFDMMVRCAAIIKRVSLTKVALNLAGYYDDEVREVLKNFRLTVVPAGTVSSEQLVNFALEAIPEEDDFDLIVIDYDSNLKDNDLENMYQSGGAVYDTLSKLARPSNRKYKVVFVGSQIKPTFWFDVIVPKAAAAESSRKQAIIDKMITIGKDHRVETAHVGAIHIAKDRRGKEGNISYFLLQEDGTFLEKSKFEYDTLVPKSGGKQKQNYGKGSGSDNRY